jgi:glycosyltransferase involved in cell wall biosynthesis
MNEFQQQLQQFQVKKSDKPSIAWLFTDWSINAYRTANDLYGGIAYYRVIKPAQVLRQWFDIEVVGAEIQHWGTADETYTRLGRDYDLILSKHLLDGQMASNILATADHFKKKVVVDVDDNYFNIRNDNPALKDYDKNKGGRYYLGAFLELANGITTSTNPLKIAYSLHNKVVDVLPNCNDVNDWPRPQKKDDGMIRIGYAGGSAHNDDLDLIVEPIARILEKYPNVLFEVMGALTVEKATNMGAKMLKFGGHKILDRFKMMGGTQAWLGYPELLSTTGWDIALCPLVDEPFNQGKSHIKWMEMSMIGAATVASPVYPYKEPIQGVDTIRHGKTGLFATTANEWFDCLEMLIRNPDVRQQINKNAYEYIKENWQYSQWADKWKAVIEKYLK